MKQTLSVTAIISMLILSCNNQAAKSTITETSTTKIDTIKQVGYATVNGLKMYYEIYGEGEPLVLIHGGGSTIGTSFGNIIPLLKNTHKIIAVELQAHGHTSDREQPESFEQDADDVAALLKQLGITKANFFGFSNGGSTTMQIAIRHPEIVNKIIVASAAYKREGFIQGFFDNMEKAELKDMPSYLKQAFMQIKNDTVALQHMFEKDRNRMIQFKDWPEESLRSIKAPALVMAADKDVITVAHTLDISQKIANSQLLIIPGTHGSFIGEGNSTAADIRSIALTVDLIDTFLKR